MRYDSAFFFLSLHETIFIFYCRAIQCSNCFYAKKWDMNSSRLLILSKDLGSHDRPHQPAILSLIRKLLSRGPSWATLLFIKHCPWSICNLLRGSKRLHILCATRFLVLVFQCTKVCINAATLSSSSLKENCWVLTWQKTAGGACSEKCSLKLWRLVTWKIWCGDHLLLSASGQWEQWFMNSLYLFGGLKRG